jgi:DNA-binding transcriptional ArsR family regulator
MADLFDVIADPTRRQLLGVLLERYISLESADGEISVGDIVEHLGLSQPTVSKHLKVLRDHGLVSVREDGQHRFYRLDASPLEDIEDWLVPFLSADFDETADSEDALFAVGSDANDELAVFAAWAGADVGDTIGRRIAEGSFQARSAIQDASEAVVRRLPKSLRRRGGH